MRTHRLRSHQRCVLGVAAALAMVAAVSAGATQTGSGAGAVIPKEARALEGTPTVRLDVTSGDATRQELDRSLAAKAALRIDIVDGRYYWTSRDGRPLTLTNAGEFVYLTSTEPGQYVRFRRLSNRIAYVEHVDMEFGSVTYWGELKIVLSK